MRVQVHFAMAAVWLVVFIGYIWLFWVPSFQRQAELPEAMMNVLFAITAALGIALAIMLFQAFTTPVEEGEEQEYKV